MYKSKSMLLSVTLLGSSLFLMPLLVNAEIFKWTDENGKIHYSDKPTGVKAKEIKINVTPATPTTLKDTADRKTRANNFLRAREEERAENNKLLAEKKRLKKVQKKKCAAAKKEFSKLSRARGIYYEDKDGTRIFIDDKKVEQVLADEKAKIKKWCK